MQQRSGLIERLRIILRRFPVSDLQGNRSTLTSEHDVRRNLMLPGDFFERAAIVFHAFRQLPVNVTHKVGDGLFPIRMTDDRERHVRHRHGAFRAGISSAAAGRDIQDILAEIVLAQYEGEHRVEKSGFRQAVFFAEVPDFRVDAF